MKLVLCLGAISVAALSQAALFNVQIRNFAFDPDMLIVNVGDSVKWTNLDFAPHTATSTSGPTSFDSGTLGNNGTFTFLFTQAGTYDYMCNIHHSMMGQINVVPEPSSVLALGLAGLVLVRRRR